MSVNIEYGPLYCGYFDEDKVDVKDLRFFTSLTDTIGHALIAVDDMFFARSAVNFKLFKLTHPRWQQELVLKDNWQGYYFTHCDESFENMVEPVADLSLVNALSILGAKRSTWTLVSKPDTAFTLTNGVAVECDEKVYLNFFTGRDSKTVLVGVRDIYGEKHVSLTAVVDQLLKPIVEVVLEMALFMRLKSKGGMILSKTDKETNHIVVVDVRQLCLLIYNHGAGSEIVGAVADEMTDRILSPILRYIKNVVSVDVEMSERGDRASVVITYQ